MKGNRGPEGAQSGPRSTQTIIPFTAWNPASSSAWGPLTAGQVATYCDLATYHLPLPQLPHLEDGDKGTDPQHY